VKTNYILVDYENVQPISLDALNSEQFKVIVFIGANQTKISVVLAIALQQMGTRAEYVQISRNGANALDFHIAFTIGQLATSESDAYFHIISKDAGFDPLIDHLKQKKIRASRSCSIADIPLVKASQAVSAAEQAALIVANLRQRGAAKPRTLKTLTRTVATLFGQKLSDADITSLLRLLEKQGIITITDTKISYTLPEEA
jgi:hypothetical protein